MDLPVDDVPLGFDLKRKKRKHSDISVRTTNSKSTAAKKYRQLHHIKVTKDADCRVPIPVSSFSMLSGRLDEQLLNNLTELSFSSPTPVQAQSIPILLKRYNLLACAPTGSGKTAAYLLPILHDYHKRFGSCDQKLSENDGAVALNSTIHRIYPFGIILAPTQELVRQIWSEAVRLARGLSDVHFIACLNRRHYADRGRQRKPSNVDAEHSVMHKKPRELRLPKSIKILVTTPYRLCQLIRLDIQRNPFDLSQLQWLIIDECDKMLETNFKPRPTHSKPSKPIRSFRDQLEPIFSILHETHNCRWDATESRPTVGLFSATVPDEVVKWIKTELPRLMPHSIDEDKNVSLMQLFVGKADSAVSTVKQELRYCGTEEGKLLEIRNLLVRGLSYPCLIFMDSRERAKEIVKEILLSDKDLLANVISSDKTEAQRFEVMRAFREGRLNVLVCTDLLGRGIDFKNVNMVVIYDVPALPEDYIHRVGRTGRAGQRGRAITLWTDADLPHLGDIIKIMRRSGSNVDAELDRLVQNWHTRQSTLLMKKTNKNKSSEKLLISRRRGERRLIKNILHNKNQRDTPDNDSIKWLRRWKTNRKPISELSGARQKKPKA